MSNPPSDYQLSKAILSGSQLIFETATVGRIVFRTLLVLYAFDEFRL